MRCHAAVIASAQGQVAWIFRCAARPPRTSRAAACSTRYRSVFGSALARSPSRASSFSQASRMQAVIEAVSQAALILKSWEGKWPAGVLPGPDGVLDPGLDPVRGVDIGVLPQPALGGGGPVRHPQRVPPAVPGFEQGQLGAGMRPLAAREHAHRGGPGLELVPVRSRAQQPGQLGDVGFLDPAAPVRAGDVRAGVIGAALADLPAAVDGELPGRLGHQPQRRLLPLPKAHPTE